MRKIFYLILIVILTVNCESTDEMFIQVKIENLSAHDFDQVTITTLESSEEFNYNVIKALTSSEYQSFDRISLNDFFMGTKINIDNQQYSIATPLINYASDLEVGKSYTFIVDIVSIENKQLKMDLVFD